MSRSAVSTLNRGDSSKQLENQDQENKYDNIMNNTTRPSSPYRKYLATSMNIMLIIEINAILCFAFDFRQTINHPRKTQPQ